MSEVSKGETDHMSIAANSLAEIANRAEFQMDEGLVKQILRVLCRKGAYLTTTRAQKLFYLIERECVLETGQRYLHLEYRYDKFGMYSPALSILLRNLDRNADLLEVNEVVTERGAGRTISCIGFRHEEHLPAPVERAVAVVLAEYGFLRTPVLISAAKETSPFIHARKGEWIDWRVLDEERCRPGEELSAEGIRELEKALKSAETSRGPTFESVDELFDYLFH